MASAWSEEECFICSVCLENMKDPATLPCGHSYCLACIKGHWDRRDSRNQYSCPQCRQVFSPRPSLARSTVLVEAMEKMRANSFKQTHMSISSAPPSMPIYLEILPDGAPQRQGSVYPQLPTVAPSTCPQHRRPLDLFCRDDMESVCEECCQHGHKGHRVLRPQEERRQRQNELAQMQADVQRRIRETESELKELPQAARQHMASVQALQRESAEMFPELLKSVELMRSQLGDLLGSHAASLCSRAEGQIHSLEQEAAQLRRKSEEMSRLADNQDNVCFLKNFFLLEPPGQNGTREESGLDQEEAVVASIRSAMTDLRDSLQDLCKSSLVKIFRVVNDGSMAPVAAGVSEAGVAAADVAAGNEASSTPPPLTPAHRRASATLPLPRPPLQGQATPPLPHPLQRQATLPLPHPVQGQATPPLPRPLQGQATPPLPRPLQGQATPPLPRPLQGQATPLPRPLQGQATPPLPRPLQGQATPPLPRPPLQGQATPTLPRPLQGQATPPLPRPPLQAQASFVNPEPKTREDMLKFRFELTMDPNTVYRHLLLSDGEVKATLRAENLNPPDHPERFQFWRQVLCREPLAGSPYYWEVEWTGQKISIGVAYKDMDRKSSGDQSRLGHNALSWSLYWSGTGFSFWHGGQETLLGSPKARRVGVYLDQHAGILAFYRIASNQAFLIHWHQGQFTGSLYPGFRFWSGVGATVTLCRLD